MRKTALFLLSLLMFSAVMAQLHVTPGMKMPNVEAEFLTNVKKPQPGKDSRIATVVVFSDINSPDFVQTLRYLESLESKYNRKSPEKWILRFQVIVPNDKASVERFLKHSEGPFAIALGSDIKGKTFRNFAVTRISDAVIGVNGAITWLGPAMDLDYIIGAILEENFSIEEYRKIAKMKMEMQTALRAGLPDVAAKTAEKILETVPNDITSIQTVLYSYEIKKQNGKAIVFLESCIAKCGKKAGGIRLLLLDRIIRSEDLSLWQKTVDEAVKNTDNIDDKLNLAAFLVDMSPRFYFPAEQVIELCNQILKSPGVTGDPEFYANALEIAARAEFAVCRIDRALNLQEQALSLRKKNKSSYEKRSLQALEYYKKIKLISGKK